MVPRQFDSVRTIGRGRSRFRSSFRLEIPVGQFDRSFHVRHEHQSTLSSCCQRIVVRCSRGARSQSLSRDRYSRSSLEFASVSSAVAADFSDTIGLGFHRRGRFEAVCVPVSVSLKTDEYLARLCRIDHRAAFFETSQGRASPERSQPRAERSGRNNHQGTILATVLSI